MKNKILLPLYVIFISIEIAFFLSLIMLASEKICSFYKFYEFNIFENKIHLASILFNFVFLILNFFCINVISSKSSKKIKLFYIIITIIGFFIFAFFQYAYIKTFLGSYACFVN
jgi:hypothetical protein